MHSLISVMWNGMSDLVRKAQKGEFEIFEKYVGTGAIIRIDRVTNQVIISGINNIK